MGFFSEIGKAFVAIKNIFIPKSDTNQQKSHHPVNYSYNGPSRSTYSNGYNNRSSNYNYQTSTCDHSDSYPAPILPTRTVYVYGLLAQLYLVFDRFLKYRITFIEPKTPSFLQLAQLDDYPLPNDILITERGEDEIPQNIIEKIR